MMMRIWNNKYIPHAPTPKQSAFLALDCLEALYGGAAGGGKSDALLMGALMFVDVPGYAALLLRRTYADLSLPEAIMSRAAEWLTNTDAHWNNTEKTWQFPSGSTLTFGYLAAEKDKYRYQSSAFQFIGFDELTQFVETQYTYLFSRLRRLESVDIPLRMRGGTNPGGIGHNWVYERFIVGRYPQRAFVPALLDENPYLDREQYRRSLAELDDTTRKQLEKGLWITDPAGKPFKREWWRGKNRFLLHDSGTRARVVGRWISWDTGLKDKDTNAYSSYVVGELMPDYTLNIRRVWRDRPIFPELPGVIEQVAKKWNYDDKMRGVIVEDKASGTSAYQTLMATSPAWLRDILVAWNPRGDKVERANQAGVWCKRDSVLLPHPTEDTLWLPEFENELFNFPDVTFKDQVDALSQLVIYLEHYLATGWHARTGETQLKKKQRERKRHPRIEAALNGRNKPRSRTHG